MHKITIYLILSTFIFFHGCQKRNQIATDDVSKREGIAFSVSQAMSWFQLNNNQTAERANSIWFRDIAPNWAKASVGEDQIWYVVEVPVRFDKDPGFVIRNPLANRENQAIDSRTILLILKNKQSGKKYSVLMHIVPKKGSINRDVSYQDRNNFSGMIFYTNLEAKFINGWEYNNGKIKATIEEVARKNGETNRAPLPVENCETVATDWYERTCIYYDDQSIECSNWMYSHTTYQTICSDGGGGGGPVFPSECNLSGSEAQATLNTMSVTMSNNGVVSAGTESGPDANGIIRKPVIVSRHSFTYSWMLGFSSTYTLIFKGIIFKSISNSVWKWESLAFDKIELTSGSTPPCFSANTSATVSGPIISSDKKIANFTASVTTTLTITCLDGYKQGTKTNSITDSYNADFLFR